MEAKRVCFEVVVFLNQSEKIFLDQLKYLLPELFIFKLTNLTHVVEILLCEVQSYQFSKEF